MFSREISSNFFPLSETIKNYTKEKGRKDLIAGLVGAIIVLPQAVAFATIAGLPPQYGLYAAIVPAIFAAAWGSSWHLVSGPTTAISLVIFSSISPFAAPGSFEFVSLVLTTSLLVGIIQILMGVMKFGKLLSFISHTVVVGFTAGAAILIASSQIKNFFGLAIAQGSSFYETVYAFFNSLEKINPYVLLVSLITLTFGIFLKKAYPKIPYMIPAMLLGSVVAYFFNAKFGFEITGIKTVGALPRVLPPFSFSQLNFGAIKELASPALAITMLALVEAVAISKAIALRSGQKINGNREIIGQGISNMVGSFFSAYPSSGSFNRSGLNFESGAKTQFSSIFAAIFLAIIILFVAPLAAFLPNAVVAAILFLVAWGLIDFHHIGEILKNDKMESGLLFITFFSTLFIELEFAIFVGVFISVAFYLHKTARPSVYCYAPNPEHPNQKMTANPCLPRCPQLNIIKVDGEIFFGSIEFLEENINKIIEKNSGQKAILFIFSGVSTIDLAGFSMLADLVKKLGHAKKTVYFSNVNPKTMDDMRRVDFLKIVGEDKFYESKKDAIAAIYKTFDKSICAGCKNKIFRECRRDEK